MDIVKEILKQNTFWENSNIEIPRLTGKWVIREDEPYILSSFDSKFITILKGMRATGKSSLMRKIIRDKILKGYSASDFGWFEFDRAMFPDTDLLDEVISYFESKNVKYIFLDEIHFVPMWQDVIKRFYDRTNLKFVVSGSSALEIDSRSSESLAGRFNLIIVKPFSFREFLYFKEIQFDTEIKIAENKGRIFEASQEYILNGGFPESVKSDSIALRDEYIKSAILDPVFYKDLPIITGQNPDLLYNILAILSSTVSSQFQLQNISNIINLNIPTVGKSLESLERSMIVNIVYNFTKSLIKKGRISKKIIFNDNGILRILNGNISISNLAENLIGSFYGADSFYRDSHGREIDWLITPIKTAIEVKYSDNISNYEIRHLKFFKSKNPEWKTVLISLTKESIIENIRIIPFWKALLFKEL